MPFLSALAAALGTSGFGRDSGGVVPFDSESLFDIFFSSGTFTLPNDVTSLEYFICGGGGGGGGALNGHGGGGGGGGVVTGTTPSVLLPYLEKMVVIQV